MSPGCNLFKNPDCSVKCLSLSLPPQAGEINEVTPCGLIAMNTFTVFEYLYCDHVAAFATK